MSQEQRIPLPSGEGDLFTKDHPNNQEDEPAVLNPPPYSEKPPHKQQPAPAGGPANPTMPTQHRPYYTPVDQAQLHTTVMVPVQPTHEPDYLVYSILTMIFCCLPLGIVALVYSIRTRDSNHMGNGSKAQQNSRMARNFAHAALGVGAVLTILYIVLVVVANKSLNG